MPPTMSKLLDFASAYVHMEYMPTSDDDLHRSLFKRAGYVPPSAFSKGIIVIFSLVGAGLSMLVWWFFFKRGGFVWHENDWDDYKSTVMRKKDANGNTISGGSTRGPETVVTETTYQSEYYDDETRTEKTGHNSDDERRRNAKKEKGKKRGFGRWGKRRNASPTSTERDRDQDLESYASEEPARMTSYNPHPVASPSIIDEEEEDITNQRDHGSQFGGAGRFPSRYAYAYSKENESQPARSTTSASEKSSPLGPRRPTKKGSTRSKRTPSRSVKPPPTELSTIDDEGESRLSFEQEDDAAFTVYSGEAPPSKGTKAYPYPVPDPTRHYPSVRKNSRAPQATKGRVASKNSYNTASTSSGSEACDSDCSCCTTDSESESDGEYRQGDIGTKVYHHPIAALTPRPPPAVVVKKNSRGPQAKKSYRDVSRGTLSSIGSEGEGSVVETVTSRVKRALGRS